MYLECGFYMLNNLFGYSSTSLLQYMGRVEGSPSQQGCEVSRNREDSGKDRSARADRPRVRCRKICPRRWRQFATANFSFRLLAFMQSSRSADAASLF